MILGGSNMLQDKESGILDKINEII
jgi:hypothetical protein